MVAIGLTGKCKKVNDNVEDVFEIHIIDFNDYVEAHEEELIELVDKYKK